MGGKTGAGSLQDAETCFQHSLETARRYTTLSLELRAAVSLAGIWADHGKHRQACELLIEVPGRFTEVLSTGDMTEARMVLQEFSLGPTTAIGQSFA